jgi:hypothetical protein
LLAAKAAPTIPATSPTAQPSGLASAPCALHEQCAACHNTQNGPSHAGCSRSGPLGRLSGTALSDVDRVGYILTRGKNAGTERSAGIFGQKARLLCHCRVAKFIGLTVEVACVAECARGGDARKAAEYSTASTSKKCGIARCAGSGGSCNARHSYRFRRFSDNIGCGLDGAGLARELGCASGRGRWSGGGGSGGGSRWSVAVVG